MNRYARTCAVLTFAAVAVFPGAAQTVLEISSVTGSLSLPWAFETVGNEDVDETMKRNLDVTLEHSGPAVSYFITVSAGDNGQFDPRLMDNGRGGGPRRGELPYRITTPADGIAKDVTTSLNATNVISGTFSAASTTQTVTQRFDAFLSGNTFSLEDLYQDTVTVTLYEGVYTDPEAAVARDSVNVAVSASIPMVYQLRLVSSGAAAPVNYDGGYDMFLGDLTNGAVGQVDLLYRTNSRYRLTATSQNGGDLVSDDGDRIPYQLIFDGKNYNFGSPMINSNSPTGVEFVRESLSVEVAAPDAQAMPPGYYQDIVTFDITAR
jgi:hypothetical protein